MPDNRTSHSPALENTSRPLGRGLLRFCAAVAGLCLVMYVIAPFLVEHISPFRQYARVVDETGIIPGALYYTDVPQSSAAETSNRNAIRFLVGKNATRK